MEAVSPRLPYGVPDDEAQTVLREVREEAIALYGSQAPPADQPYFGGVTWQEYQALPDEERQALWDRLYAEFDVETESGWIANSDNLDLTGFGLQLGLLLKF